MKCHTHVYASASCALALLVLGCAPTAGVNDNYGPETYTGGFAYTARPVSANVGETYSSSASSYNVGSVEVVPRVVTTPRQYGPYHGNDVPYAQ